MQERTSREIFASHYDAARAVRKYQGADLFQSLMTMKSFKGLKERKVKKRK